MVIRLVPGTLREASYALGSPRWRTVWHVVLPTARSGLTTAVILGTARGVGETSPVLLTAGFGAGTNYSPTHNPMVSLPLATFEFVKSPQPSMIARGFGAAAVLLVLVLVLFVTARLIGPRAAVALLDWARGRWVPKWPPNPQRSERPGAAVALLDWPRERWGPRLLEGDAAPR